MIDDVLDMSVEVDVGRQQVFALAETGHGRCRHDVACPAQDRRNVLPDPAAMPGAMDQHIGAARSCLSMRHRSLLIG